MANDPTRLLVLLQNVYDKGALKKGYHPAVWRHEFQSSRTGRRLLSALPTGHEWRIHYANVAPGIGRGSRSKLEASAAHLRRALRRVHPTMVLACGRQAEELARTGWWGALIVMPHPAYMCLTNELLERCRLLLTAWCHMYDRVDRQNHCHPDWRIVATNRPRIALRQRRGHIEAQDLQIPIPIKDYLLCPDS